MRLQVVNQLSHEKPLGAQMCSEELPAPQRSFRRYCRFSMRCLLALTLVAASCIGGATYVINLPRIRAERFFAAVKENDIDAATQMLSTEEPDQNLDGIGHYYPAQRRRMTFRVDDNNNASQLRWGECVFIITVPNYTDKFGADHYFVSTYDGVVTWWIIT